MKPSERYLRQATRGLWGKEKRALRTELQGHIHERTAEFRLGGLRAEEAERQTLRELGAPERVSSGMLGVHTLPAMGKAGALSVLLATILLTVVLQSSAQVKGIYGRIEGMAASSLLDFDQLRRAIEEAGGELKGSPNDATVTVPGVLRPAYPLQSAGWPAGTLVQGQRTYLRTDTLMNALLRSGADVKLTGWKNPTLKVGSASITIDTDDWRVINGLYVLTLSIAGPELTAGTVIASLEPNGNTGSLMFTGHFEKDGIYALITPAFDAWFSKSPDGKVIDQGSFVLQSNINQAQAGRIQFRMDNDARDFQFYPSVEAFQTALNPYRDNTRAFDIKKAWDEHG